MRTCATILLLALFTRFATAQTSPSMVNAPTSPLVLESETSTLSDFLGALRLKNISGKPISSFQLGYIKIVAAACGPVEVIAPEELFDTDHARIASGAEFTTRSYGLGPSVIERFGILNGATDVQVQVAVVSVQFSDGTSWSFPRTARVYDDARMTRNALLHCSKIP